MRSIRSWFTEERASEPAQDYTSLLLAQALLTAKGINSIKSTAAFRGSLELIGHAAGVASLSGLHSGSLEGHLSQIAREMVDTGESTWLINVGSTGGMILLPCSVASVTGGPDPQGWIYSVQMPGPTETVTIQRSGESILSFRLRRDSRSPWKGRPAIDGTGTGQLLCQLERQLLDESKVKVARVVAGGSVADQAQDISELIGAGGIVGITQAISSRDDPSGIKAGIVRNEVTAPSVTLHGKLNELVCGAMGVPSDLVLGSSSESGSRESMRRLGSTTIQNILTTISREWTETTGLALEWNLDQLRSSDEVSRARAVGSRAQAVGRLVDSGMALPEALTKVGFD